MAHEILSVKLCELDEQFARMHSRIQMSEAASAGRLGPEIEALKKEYAESELSIRGSLQRSKAATPSALLGAYEQIEETVKTTLASLQGFGVGEDDAEKSAERMMLLAEYELDFAMLAANRALLIALTAIDSQHAQERKEEMSDARS